LRIGEIPRRLGVAAALVVENFAAEFFGDFNCPVFRVHVADDNFIRLLDALKALFKQPLGV
jgi:hypothetical protein